uniref:Cilia- and flagella-associated protein 157 n=1 Tax=Rhabditophanes sp. KR3021 TaxID=114890 RepID=A0AC35TTC2_9BILA
MADQQDSYDHQLLISAAKKWVEQNHDEAIKVNKELVKMSTLKVPYTELSDNFHIDQMDIIELVDHNYEYSMDQMVQENHALKVTNSHLERDNKLKEQRLAALSKRAAYAETNVFMLKDQFEKSNEKATDMIRELADLEYKRIDRYKELLLNNEVLRREKSENENDIIFLRQTIADLKRTTHQQESDLLELNKRVSSQTSVLLRNERQIEEQESLFKDLQERFATLQAKYNVSLQKENEVEQGCSRIKEDMIGVLEELELARQTIKEKEKKYLEEWECKESLVVKRFEAEITKIQNAFAKEQAARDKEHSQNIKKISTNMENILDNAASVEKNLIKERNNLADQLEEARENLKNAESHYRQKYSREMMHNYAKASYNLNTNAACSAPLKTDRSSRSDSVTPYARTLLNELRGGSLGDRASRNEEKENSDRKQRLKEIVKLVIPPPRSASAHYRR